MHEPRRTWIQCPALVAWALVAATSHALFVVCVCVCVFVCVCVCVRAVRAHVCVCVCVRLRARVCVIVSPHDIFIVLHGLMRCLETSAC